MNVTTKPTRAADPPSMAADGRNYLPAAPAGNLPAVLTSFVGRAREVREVEGLLSGARLLTLVGPGNHVYARGRVLRLHGRQTVRLALQRRARRGRYRLEVRARSERGGLADVRTTVKGRLR